MHLRCVCFHDIFSSSVDEIFTTSCFPPPPSPLPPSLQVFEKLKLAEKTKKEIEISRDGYRPAAQRGAILFFVLSDMAAINTMYQYSLSSYLGVFNYSLSHSLPDSHLPKRLKNIIDTLTLNVYNYACTGKRRRGEKGEM